jgi:hypothetical protein
MLGFTKKDLDNMMACVTTAIEKTNEKDDPWLHGSLCKTHEFLGGLWAEGYFD